MAPTFPLYLLEASFERVEPGNTRRTGGAQQGHAALPGRKHFWPSIPSMHRTTSWAPIRRCSRPHLNNSTHRRHRRGSDCKSAHEHTSRREQLLRDLAFTSSATRADASASADPRPCSHAYALGYSCFPDFRALHALRMLELEPLDPLRGLGVVGEANECFA